MKQQRHQLLGHSDQQEAEKEINRRLMKSISFSEAVWITYYFQYLMQYWYLIHKAKCLNTCFSILADFFSTFFCFTNIHLLTQKSEHTHVAS